MSFSSISTHISLPPFPLLFPFVLENRNKKALSRAIDLRKDAIYSNSRTRTARTTGTITVSCSASPQRRQRENTHSTKHPLFPSRARHGVFINFTFLQGGPTAPGRGLPDGIKARPRTLHSKSNHREKTQGPLYSILKSPVARGKKPKGSSATRI